MSVFLTEGQLSLVRMVTSRNSSCEEVYSAWGILVVDLAKTPGQYRSLLRQISECCPVGKIRDRAFELLKRAPAELAVA